MVDFHQRRNRMEPSRSLPMSVLNQGERSDNTHTVNTATSRVAVKRMPARSRSTTNDNPPHTPSRSFTPPHQHDTHRSGLVLSAPLANPYSNTNNRVKARRTQSHSSATARANFMNRERSSSPSKDPTSLCPSSPAECLIPSSSKRRSSSFGILKAILRAVTLILIGFGAGMAYNMWQARHGTNGNHIMDLESIPSVLLTDELVKKLAQDNQLQEAEIQTLKQQVEDARKMAEQREQSESENNSSNNKPSVIQSHEDIPDQISIGNAQNGGRVYKHKKRTIDARLRPGKRFVWDNEGNMKEVPYYQTAAPASPPQAQAHAPEGPPQQDQPPPPEQPEPQPQPLNQEQAQAEQQQKEKQQQHDIKVPEVKHHVTEQQYQEHYQQQHQQHQEYQESFHTFLS